MSPQVSNFVHELVDMAKAVELVPQLQSEVDQLHSKLSEAERHNQGLETNIISYKQQIEDLASKVRSLEVERDDASFRVLEAVDTAHSVLTQARAAQDILAKVIAKLDPPKPEPETQPQAVPSEPIVDTAAQSMAATPYEWPPQAPQDQSEADPTTTPVYADTPQPIASPIAQDASTADPEPTPKWSLDWYAWNDRRNERVRAENEREAQRIAQKY